VSSTYDPNESQRRPRKPPILGQAHGLSDEEGEAIQQEATTQMSAETARVITESKVRQILHMFNRDYLYGQGRFDEYRDGLILKWGDGYSRKHIWLSVENGNLVFETSHFRKCTKSYCTGTHHVLTPDLYTNLDVVNQELGDLFRRPVHERSDD
jgi:hypothetical protein